MGVLVHNRSKLFLLTLLVLVLGAMNSPTYAQNPSHPDAQPLVPENPYISYRDAWRWDLRSQLFLRPITYRAYERSVTNPRSVNSYVEVVPWSPKNIEFVFPVVRQGGHYWTHNEDVSVSIRLDSNGYYDSFPNYVRGYDAPIIGKDVYVDQKFVEGTNAEYTHWESGEIEGEFSLLHIEHLSHIVCADTVFNEKLARQLPWPDEWSPEASTFLTPIVDTVGAEVPDDADETIATLVEYWVGKDIDPKSASQLDAVKYLTAKVFEYYTERGQGTKFVIQQNTPLSQQNRDLSFPISAELWGGFIVRPAHVVAREPDGSRHDLAVLLTSVLRSAGVPARTVICIDQEEPDRLLNTVSIVEFAMHDPERDLTFWVPIDVNRVRVTGARSVDIQRQWLYFGTHDELNSLIPISYYFHPPARYKAFDLPMLYGIRSVGETVSLPDNMIQGLLVEPILTPMSGATGKRQP